MTRALWTHLVKDLRIEDIVANFARPRLVQCAH